MHLHANWYPKDTIHRRCFLVSSGERFSFRTVSFSSGRKLKALIDRLYKVLPKDARGKVKVLGPEEFVKALSEAKTLFKGIGYDITEEDANSNFQKESVTLRQNKNDEREQFADEYESTDEFRRVQEESRSLSPEEISRYHREGNREKYDDARERLAGIYGRLLSRNASRGLDGWSLVGDYKGKLHSLFKIGRVSPSIFHDIFEINRNYLENGELVDLHDDYSDCKCFITDDGLAGFAIEPDGNLVSVFSNNPIDKRGFTGAIKDLVREQGATHLDAYASNRQNLEDIYRKTLGFYVASEMDYNMEYDHDNIAENHGNPKVVFMTAYEAKRKHFSEDQYDEAAGYAKSVVDENASRIRFLKTDDGRILGFVNEKTGEIVLNSEQANITTPIHEIGIHALMRSARMNGQTGVVNL